MSLGFDQDKDFMSYHSYNWYPVPKNHLNQNFWSLSIEEVHIGLGQPSMKNWDLDKNFEKTSVDDNLSLFDQNSFFPVNKNLRAILSLNSSVIMLPSRYINQLIKSFDALGINCYMKDMHFKCNNFVNT